MNQKEIEVVLKLKDELSKNMGKTGTQIDKTSKQLNNQASAMGRNTSKAKGMGIAMGGAVKVIGAMAFAYGTNQLLGSLTSANDAYREFEQQLADVSTLIEGDSVPHINALRDGINGVARELPTTAEDLGVTAYDVLSAGFTNVNDQLAIMRSSAELGIAGLGSTASAADIVTSAINAFGLKASDADMVANSVFKTVKNGKTTVDELSQSFGATAGIVADAGISFEDFNSAVATMTQSGLPASQAQNSIRQAVVSLTKRTKEMDDIFNSMGVGSLKELTEQGYSLGQILEMVSKEAGYNEATLTDAFGSVEAYNTVLGITGEKGAIYNEILKDMTTGTADFDEALAKQTETASSQAQILANRQAEASRTIGESFESARASWENLKTDLMEGAAEAAPYINELFTSILDGEYIVRSFADVAESIKIDERQKTQLDILEDQLQKFEARSGINLQLFAPSEYENIKSLITGGYLAETDLLMKNLKVTLTDVQVAEGLGISLEQAREFKFELFDLGASFDDFNINALEGLYKQREEWGLQRLDVDLAKMSVDNLNLSAEDLSKTVMDMGAAETISSLYSKSMTAKEGIDKASLSSSDFHRNLLNVKSAQDQLADSGTISRLDSLRSTFSKFNGLNFGGFKFNIPAFADGGEFVTTGPQLIMVGDNPGGRERVSITPESSRGRNGGAGGSSSSNIYNFNINGGNQGDIINTIKNVLAQETNNSNRGYSNRPI